MVVNFTYFYIIYPRIDNRIKNNERKNHNQTFTRIKHRGIKKNNGTKKNMKLEYITPIILNHCIEFLNKRPIGTTYHPQKNTYILDGKTTTKIIRHKGNLRSPTQKNEIKFFTRLLKYAANNEYIIQLIKTKESYKIEEYSKHRTFSIKLTKIKKFNVFKGRKPELIQGGKNVPIGES